MQTIGPEFVLEVSDTQTSTSASNVAAGKNPFHPESPAGKLYADHADFFSKLYVQWRDPWETPIGVGSSTAQFLLLYRALNSLEAENFSLWELLSTYKKYAPLASGADLLAQHLTGTVFLQGLQNKNTLSAEPIPRWSIENAALFLLPTDQKIKTHEHLDHLISRGFPQKFKKMTGKLEKTTQNAKTAWVEKNAEKLGKLMNEYQATLSQEKLGTPWFEKEIQKINASPGVLGCKGSGAQGGDCILVLIQKSKANEFQKNYKRAIVIV